MDQLAPPAATATPLDGGLRALCGIAAFYRIAADPAQLSRELALHGRARGRCGHCSRGDDDRSQGPQRRQRIQQAARHDPDARDRAHEDGAFQVLGGRNPSGLYRLVDPISHTDQEIPLDRLHAEYRRQGRCLLRARSADRASIRRTSASAGSCRRSGAIAGRSAMCWSPRCSFRSSRWSTPLFFQVVVDKVLTHKGYSTLFVLVGGLRGDRRCSTSRCNICAPTRSRTPPTASTSNSASGCSAILLRLPLSYFETRPAGQTVARMRELETIRSFLTGQGLFSAIDLVLHLRVHRGVVRLFVEADAHRPGDHSALLAHRLSPSARRCASRSKRNSIAAQRVSNFWSRRSSACRRSRRPRSSR